jgi:hypothetical protein
MVKTDKIGKNFNYTSMLRIRTGLFYEAVLKSGCSQHYHPNSVQVCLEISCNLIADPKISNLSLCCIRDTSVTFTFYTITLTFYEDQDVGGWTILKWILER